MAKSYPSTRPLWRTAILVAAALAGFAATTAVHAAPPDPAPIATVAVTQQHTSRATGYYPHGSKLEGGFKDMQGSKLYTLQAFLKGKAPYVSVAMDKKAGIPYGTKLRIPELETAYNRPIEFRVVDTGSAFKNRGFSRIDICTANYAASISPHVNRDLTLIFER